MHRHEMIDRFCESRYRWLIVTAVTLVVALATVLPQVDQYLSLHADELEKAEELAEAGRTVQMLDKLRERVEETSQKLEALERRTLPNEAVSDFRNQVVRMVRESGCQVRRIGVGAVRARTWRENDKPLADDKYKAGPNTPFLLETRPVSLAVTGSTDEVKELLTKIETNGMLTHAKGLNLRPAGRSGGDLQLDLELWCFALQRGKAKT
ncbi:MAG: hypothetical protein AAGF31_04640 [Planctomycetota bacterium]